MGAHRTFSTTDCNIKSARKFTIRGDGVKHGNIRLSALHLHTTSVTGNRADDTWMCRETERHPDTLRDEIAVAQPDEI